MNWPKIKLADASDVITKGTTPTTMGFDFTEVGIPFIRVQNLIDGTVSHDTDPLFISDETHKVLKRSIIHPNDVLVSIAGTIGRVAIVPANAPEMNCNQAVAIMRPKAAIDRRYLLHWMSSENAIQQIARGKVTGTISNLSLSQIGALEVPLPPLEEQKRIAAILDQAAELRRLRQRAIDRLNELGRAIFYEMFGDPATNPKGLPTRPLEELIKVSSGLGLTSTNQNGGNYPVYGGNGISGWHDEYTVPADTIIIGRVGVYCGVVHVTEKEAWVTDNALIVTKNKSDLNTAYLAAALKYANLNQYAGRSAQPLVSGARIYPIHIAVPANEDQSRFQSRLIEHSNLVGDFSAHLSNLDHLFSSLQNLAFRGEL